MKIFRKLFAFLSAAVMTVSAASMPAFAENPTKVIDDADILSVTEEVALQGKIEDVIEKYQNAYDIVILTVNSTNGRSIVSFADDYYDYNDYGYDSESSGLIFVVDMGGRQWYISTCGRAISAFTDYGLDKMGEKAASYLSNGNYYSGFSKFIDIADEYIDQFESTGIAYDVPKHSSSYDYEYGYERSKAKTLLVAALCGLITAFIVSMSFKSQLKTAKMQTNAQHYIRMGSFHVTHSSDQFLYKNVTKTKIESSSGGGSYRGGSRTHRSSSGRSHGGRGGRF